MVGTKDRRQLITPELRQRLDPFIGGFVRDLGGSLYAAGGMPDHSHFLVRWGTDKSVGDLMRHAKSRSSRWIHETFPEHRSFAWQKGYGVFSVSESKVEEVRAYIGNQAEHHRVRTFEEEYRAFLDAHGIDYDPRDLFD